jgi:hypothetical protein
MLARIFANNALVIIDSTTSSITFTVQTSAYAAHVEHQDAGACMQPAHAHAFAQQSLHAQQSAELQN